MASHALDRTLSSIYVRPKSVTASRQAHSEPVQKAVPVTDLLDPETLKRPVFLLGAPGSGKSTVLRQLALAAWWRHRDIGFQTKFIPVLIPLRVIAALQGSLHTRLAQGILKTLPLTEGIDESCFVRWSDSTDVPILLLLDGLDEVAPDDRAAFIPWFNSLMATCPWPVVVTCRSNAIWPYAHAKGATYIELVPFDSAQVREMAANWFGGSGGEFVQWLAVAGVGRWHWNPLMLTVAAIVFESSGGVVKARAMADLYESFIEIVLSEAAIKGVERDLQVPTDMLVALAEVIATSVSVTAMRSYIGDLLLKRGLATTRMAADAVCVRLLKQVVMKSGLIVGTPEQPRFLHETIREYLSARRRVSDLCYSSKAIAAWIRLSWNSEYRQSTIFALSIYAKSESTADDVVAPVLADLERALTDEGEDDLYDQIPALASYMLDVVRWGTPFTTRTQFRLMQVFCELVESGIFGLSNLSAIEVFDIVCVLPSREARRYLRDFAHRTADEGAHYSALVAVVGLPSEYFSNGDRERDIELLVSTGCKPCSATSRAYEDEEFVVRRQFDILSRLYSIGREESAKTVLASMLNDREVAPHHRLGILEVLEEDLGHIAFVSRISIDIAPLILDMVRTGPVVPHQDTLRVLSRLFVIDPASLLAWIPTPDMDIDEHQLDEFAAAELVFVLRMFLFEKYAISGARRILRTFGRDCYVAEYVGAVLGSVSAG